MVVQNKKSDISSSDAANRKLVVEPSPHVTGPMTKDLLMKYTFVALCILAAIAILAFGITALIMEITAVLVAIVSDYLLFMVMKKKGPLNTYSAAVCGLIVALSFSGGIPYTGAYNTFLDPTYQVLAVAVISAIAVIVFKKSQGLLGRKYVNPAAATKLLVLAPLVFTALIPSDHAANNIATPEGLKTALTMSYSAYPPEFAPIYSIAHFSDPLLNLTILKSHGWLGGASSIAVIAVGIALILISRGYMKWRIPLTYLATIAVISGVYGVINADDIVLRIGFHLFVGSVIFLAFFMATDPATTPLTGSGQIIFAIGLGILTVVFQLFGFFGGSILALVIMNLTVSLLDRVGIHKPFGRR